MNDEIEIWKTHPEFIDYEGSNLGRIRRKETQRIKKQFTNKSGRFFVEVYKNGKPFVNYTHRFICECFYGINDDLTVDHIDSNPANNLLSNLRYLPFKENISNPNSKKKRKSSKTTSIHEKVKCFDLNGNFIGLFDSAKEAVEKLKLSINKRASNFITNVCCGLAKSAYGYKWEYADDCQSLIDGEIFKKHPVLNVETSNLGRIRKKYFGRYRISIGTNNGCGYLKTTINGKGYFVHRLVAETFIPNPNHKKEVNHINSDTKDNRVENLEWTTHEENLKSETTVKGKAFKVDLYNLDGEFIETFPSLTQMCKKMGFDLKSVRMCLKEKYKQHHNYTFKYHL